MEIIGPRSAYALGSKVVGQLAKALLLPLLAIVFTSLSALALLFGGSGTTQLSLWVVDAEGDLQQRVDTVMLEAPLRVRPEGAEGSVEPAGCADRGRQVVMESDANDAGERLQASLASKGVVACGGWEFKFNVPSSDSSGAARAIEGWPRLLVLLLGVGVLFYVDRTRGEARNGDTAPLRHVMNVGVGLLGAIAVLACSWVVALAFPEAAAAHMARADATAGFGLVPLLTICLAAPLLEEIACRAWLMPIAGKVLGGGGAVAFSSVVFALSHGIFEVPDLIFYAAAGLVFAFVWLRTRSLLACVIAHGAYNTWVALPLFLT